MSVHWSRVVTVLVVGCSVASLTGFLAEFRQMLSQDKYFDGHGKPDPLETILFPLVLMEMQ